MTSTYEHDAYRYAIRNAYEHKGRADPGALIGKLKALYPDSNIKDLVPVAKAACEKVNRMGMDEIHVEYEKFQAEGFELKIPEKKVGLLDLDWAANEPVVTRYAPNPSAPGHMGHMRAALLSYLYAKKYGGKFILRFDDTDPKLKKPFEGAEEMYLSDLAWFGITPDMLVHASDRMEIYYDYMHQLIEMGEAYVCTCDKDAWKKKILKHHPCPCRELPVEDMRTRFQQFMKGVYKEGGAVLRVKTDLHLDDPSQIDFPLARYVDEPQHYRVKDKHVWPMYNFASAIDDHLMGITLIIRGQEHFQNTLKQKWIYQHFGWNYPHYFHTGRLLMKDVELSKSKMLLGIKTKKYSGWDDPKLFTIRALQRKGFTPQGITALIVDLGVKPSDTTLDLQLLGTFNKPFVEQSPSFHLIQDPISLEVDFGPEMVVNLDGKNYPLKPGNQSFFIARADTQKWNVGSILRLRNAYVVKVNHKEDLRLNAQFVSTAKLENTSQTNWLIEGVDVRIILPTGAFVFGIADPELAGLQIGSEVFFPGLGYCRVDDKNEKEVQLWFTHP